MITITGIVKGVKTVPVNYSDGNTGQRHYVGIETNKEGGYEGETIVTDLQVSRAQYEAGILAYFTKYVGQALTVPMWVSPWVSKTGNTGLNYHLGGDGKAVSGSGSAKAA